MTEPTDASGAAGDPTDRDPRPSGEGLGAAFFDALYEGTPGWDIGRPQREIVRLAEAGEIQAPVLDVGCGTGEVALYLAALGLETVGVDAAPAAIDRAIQKARERGLEASFHVTDALRLGELGRIFRSAVDCGLFHVFSDDDRPRFAASLWSALEPGGTYFLLCYSEREPGGPPPRRVSQAEIRDTFGEGWRVESVDEATFETNFRTRSESRAWLARITRL
jgi:cyclopropane fatty-acyl-phospholipid synthase-like methyltransferase